MYQKNQGRPRRNSLHYEDEADLKDFSTGGHMTPSSEQGNRRVSNSICVGNLQIHNERRLPAFPIRRQIDYRTMNRQRIPTISSMEVFHEQAPRYDFYEPQAMQYSYVTYERTDRLTSWWRYFHKNKHIILPWVIGVVVSVTMIALITTQTVQDFKKKS